MLPYVLRSFRGGISDENDKGIAGSFKHGHALDIHSRDDVLKCGQTMATVFSGTNTTQSGIVQFFVPASDGSLYCFGNTGSIFAISNDGQWTFVYNDENGAIKGATEWELNDGINYLWWATGSSIARKPLPGNDAAWDSNTARWTDAVQDYKVENISSSAVWHTMKPAGGLLAIANGQGLATVTFAGAFNPFGLNIRPGNFIKCIDERDDYVILGSEREDESEEGHIWSWISGADPWVQKKKIPVKGVNALINTELLLLQGGDDGELFFSDFVNAVPLHGVPGGGQVDPGGVSIFDDRAIFGFYGSSVTYPGLWSYGRKRKNRPHSLNYDYRLVATVNGSTISTIAAVTTYNDSLFASWGVTDGSTSDYGVDQLSTTTKATALYESLEFDNQTPFLKKKFDTVKLTMAPLPSGASVSVKFKTDKATTGGDSSAGAGWRYALVGGGATTTFSTTNETEAIFIIGDFANVFEVGVELNASGNDTPEVLSVSTYLREETYEF